MTDLVTLTIDDRQVSVPKGTLVVDAAAKLSIEIPVFCSHPKLDPVACCRMCLVEISGPARPDVADGLFRARGAGHGRQDRHAAGEGGAGGQSGLHPAQPPARLPHLRQGRRMPVAGSDHALRPRPQPVGRSQAPQEQALSHLRHHRARPGALRRLLALHPLSGGVGRQAAAWRSSSAAARRSSTSRMASRSTPRPAATSSTSARSAR